MALPNSRVDQLPKQLHQQPSHLWRLGVLAVMIAATSIVWLSADRRSSVPPPVPGAVHAPSISWSEKSLEVTLSPGKTASRSLTFTSSEPLTNIRIEAVPEIAPFATISPTAVDTVTAAGPQTVKILFAIPSSASFGDYQGTIHVRFGRQTLAQTLGVSLGIWQQIREPVSGIAVHYPPKWTAFNLDDALVLSESGSPSAIEGAEGTDIVLRSYPFVGASLDDWVESTTGVMLNSIPRSEMSRGSTDSGLRFTTVRGYLPSGSPDDAHAYILAGDKVLTIETGHYSYTRTVFDRLVQSATR